MYAFVLTASFLLQQPGHKPSVFDIINPHTDIVATAKGAYALMPAKLIDSEDVSQSSWSSDGSYLMYEKDIYHPSINGNLELTNSPEDTEKSICFWSVNTQTNSMALTMSARQGSIEQAVWLPKANVALVITRQQLPSGPDRDAPVDHYSLLRLKPGDTTPLVLLEDDTNPSDPGMALDICPTRPIALVFKIVMTKGSEHREVTDLVVNQASKLVAVKAPDAKSFVSFNADGKAICLVRDPSATKGQSAFKAFPVDEVNGQVSSANIPWVIPQRSTGPTLALALEVTEQPAANAKTSKEVEMVWLKSLTTSDQPTAFVAGEATQGALSPALNAVSYKSQGSLFVREIVPCSLEAMQAVVLENAKQEAMMRAKQVGLGLFMLGADMDDKLPGQSDFASAIQPYLKDADLLNGFKYLFQGGNMANIASPADTPFGYTAGPGGRAMVYADGHVRWIPNG
jgi:hypothetical protein